MGGYAMIVQEFTIDDYDWKVKIYYSMSYYPLEEIIKDLNDLGCSSDDIEETIDLLDSKKYDAGVTHSNIYERRSVIIISPSSSAEEFFNTIIHEIGHITIHISIADGIDPFSEELQYLSGYIGKEAFKVCEKLLCNKCRKALDI